ncbi:MAG: divergent PAP2 family protein [Clostridia bacterium]|nr:divergent PAP2 family protein [Clostridia bacterium]
MNVIRDFFSNRVVLAAFAAWAIAQGIKVILTLIITKKFDMSRLVGSGGMPSSHSALVCAMVTSIGYAEGFSSSVFALGACFAAIVMYDAAGVRRSTGKNAAVLNHLLDGLAGNGFVFDEERLKELVGHTPVQVVAGALLGILVGTLIG